MENLKTPGRTAFKQILLALLEEKRRLLLVFCIVIITVILSAVMLTVMLKDTNPIVDVTLDRNGNDEAHKGLALTAERRLVLTGPRGNGSVRPLCAEPSPDTAAALAEFFSFRPEDEKKETLGGALASGPFSIFSRSQGVQFYRDSVFALCQAAMNGWIGTRQSMLSGVANQAYMESMEKYYQGFPDYYRRAKEYNKDLDEYNEALAAYNRCIIADKKESCSENPPIKPDPPMIPRYPLSEFETALFHIRKDAVEIIKAEVMQTAFVEELKKQTLTLPAMAGSGPESVVEQTLIQSVNPEGPPP